MNLKLRVPPGQSKFALPYPGLQGQGELVLDEIHPFFLKLEPKLFVNYTLTFAIFA